MTALVLLLVSLSFNVAAKDSNNYGLISGDHVVTMPVLEQIQTIAGKPPTISEVNDGDKKVKAIVLDSGDTVEWKFDAETSGEYSMSIRYLPIKNTSNEVELSILINESLGSDNLDKISLKRIWKDATEPVTDKKGNELKPQQVEAGVFNTTTVRSKLSNSDAKYVLNKGENKISISVNREKIAISEVVFTPINSNISYNQYLENNSVKPSNDGYVYIEAENAKLKSDPTLYALSDRSSPTNSPSHHYKNVLNTIGGGNWKYTQQWLEWEFEVKSAGFYDISMRLKQNARQGQNSSRRVYIDGNVPFEELNSVSIPYKNGWQKYSIGDGNQNYKIYLEVGTHTLRLENTIGEISDVLTQTNELVRKLNQAYRNILVYIGNTPDTDRDYQLDVLMPNLKNDLEQLLNETVKIKEALLKVSAEKGEDYAQFEDLERQLNIFIQSRSKITLQFDRFRTNIGSLSEWLLRAQEQAVLIDYIEINSGENQEKKEAGFLEKIWFEVKAFFASFFVDYSVISSADEAQDEVTIWLASNPVALPGMVASGRDQAVALKSVIDTYFTPQHNMAVNLKLVDINSLIPAVATANGPDMALFLPSKSIMDYGFRGALYDISTFDDYKKGIEPLFEQAVVPFTYNNSTFAVPDSYIFNLMFYRTDILNDLKLEIPKTWDDVYKILPEMNNNYLSFGLPSLSVDNIEIFTTMLYQQDVNCYDANGTRALFDTEQGIHAFERWADLYTKYNVPQKLDLLTYFRTGETPLIVAPYTFYNNLAVGAPEIDGLWGATLVPGTKGSNDQINHSVTSLATGSVIFKNTSNPKASWEFLKWWVSDEAQYRYGIEVETTLGPAGRVATPNKNALQMLPWSRAAVENITQQMQSSRALPEVPGGYMSLRYIPTAMRLVVNNNIYPRDALISYTKLINDEISSKRTEFHFD